jgi:hypothetical protein
MYAFLQKGDNAVLIFLFNRINLALKILQEAGIPILNHDQVCHG